jgi:Urea transporter
MADRGVPRRAADNWATMAERNPAVGAVDTLLRGVGQVMFQNNPLTGLLFLVGIFVNSFKFGGAGLLGLAASTLAAHLLGVDRALIRAGLFGFNGILVGITLAFFFEFDFLLAVYIILGAAVSTVVMMALINLLTPWDMPALTAPFVLTTWLLLFAVYQFDFLQPTALIAPLTPEPEAAVQTALRELATGTGGLTLASLAHSLFRGVGEVMFEDNLLTGGDLPDRHPGQLADLGSLRRAGVGGGAADGPGLGRRRLLHLPRAVRLQRRAVRHRPRRPVLRAHLEVGHLRAAGRDVQRDRVRRHRSVARPDRHARPHRPLRAHHLAVPMAQGGLPGARAGGAGRRHNR